MAKKQEIQAKAPAVNSAGADAIPAETALKINTQMAAPYLDKSPEELIQLLITKDELIENIQKYLKDLEGNSERLKDRIERQDERIDKALSLIKVGNRKFRALKIMAKVLGRIVIFGEELKRVKNGAVLFSSLPEDEQMKIYSAAPHIFEEINS